MNATTSKCCVVFGATGGLGSALSKILVESLEQELVLVGRTQKEGVDIRYWCDNRRFSDVFQTLDSIETNHGEIGSVIDLSGVIQMSLFSNLDSDQINEIINTNLLGPLNIAKALIQKYQGKRQVKLILFSSVVVENSVLGANIYATTKSAIEAFVKSSAKELFRKNILINAIRLGYFDTGMTHEVPQNVVDRATSRTAVERLGTASDLAPLVKYLLEDATEYMVGATISLTGGD
jgi:NAD(P)-dependent dehydrogenase (short-subunit alcohol dehydrogenase family)